MHTILIIRIPRLPKLARIAPVPMALAMSLKLTKPADPEKSKRFIETAGGRSGGRALPSINA